MEDSRIVQLYWERSKEAVPATALKYGRYCTSIAMNIVGNREDAEECVNDVYLNAWNSMPPHRPEVLSAFLGKLRGKYAGRRDSRNGGVFYDQSEQQGRKERDLLRLLCAREHRHLCGRRRSAGTGHGSQGRGGVGYLEADSERGAGFFRYFKIVEKYGGFSSQEYQNGVPRQAATPFLLFCLYFVP